MSNKSTPNLNYCWAELIIEELVRNGVDTFCISSGSRSSPLTLAVASNPKAKSIVHFDERGSAFYALGHASATKFPCAIITTSGTAAANLFPAIIEASKKKVPLIILTADRPPELRFTGAHQTIDQVKIFGDYARWFYDFPCPTTKVSPETILTTVDQAVYRAQGELKGPVHLNCMFREPLVPVKSRSIPANYAKNIRSWQKNNSVFTQYIKPRQDLKPSDIADIGSQINKIKSGIIVVGKLATRQDRESVLKLADKLNWPIFPDFASGLRLGRSHKNIFPYFDQALLSDKFKSAFKPDGVLHLGGRITSKRWYEYIDEIRPKHYVMVLNHPLRNDPLHNVTARIQCDISSFCETFSQRTPAPANGRLLKGWNELNETVHQTVTDFLQKRDQMSEIHTARLITEFIPEGDCLFSSNSMPIRELDMYGSPGKNPMHIGANRGASGIDGVIATAAGFCAGHNKRTTLLIGDLAFLYDLNSLPLLKGLKQPMVMVVLNNNGGGIFSFLPVKNIKTGFEQYFGTPHNLTFSAAAELFDLNYAQPRTTEEFVKTYALALKGRGSTIIEVFSDRAANVDIHTALQKEIKRKIDAHYNNKNGVEPWAQKPLKPKRLSAGQKAASTRILNTQKQTA